MSESIPVCPECDSSSIRRRSGARGEVRERGTYRCMECGHECRRPARREREHAPNIGNLSAIGRAAIGAAEEVDGR